MSKGIIVLIILIIIVVGGILAWQYLGVKEEAPREFSCEKDEDCVLAYTGMESCAPCDAADESMQCVSPEEAERLREERKKKHGVVFCEPCPPSYTCQDEPCVEYECACLEDICTKVEAEGKEPANGEEADNGDGLTNGEEPPDGTAGWQTYRDEDYHFEVKYPPAWKVKEKDLMTDVGHLSYFWAGELAIDVWDFSTYSFDEIAQAPPGGVDQVEREETVFESYPAVEFSYIEVGEAGMGEKAVKLFFVKKNDLVYQIKCGSEECGQILSTFRFID